MKTLKNVFLMFAFAGAFVACKKSNDTTPDILQYKVNNVQKSLKQYDYNDFNDYKHFYGIMGMDESENMLHLNFPFNNGKGTYTMGNTYNGKICGAVFAINGNVNGGFVSTSGSIIVTEATSDFIQGTFSFEAKNNITNETFTITEGVFSRNHVSI